MANLPQKRTDDALAEVEKETLEGAGKDNPLALKTLYALQALRDEIRGLVIYPPPTGPAQ